MLLKIGSDDGDSILRRPQHYNVHCPWYHDSTHRRLLASCLCVVGVWLWGLCERYEMVRVASAILNVAASLEGGQASF